MNHKDLVDQVSSNIFKEIGKIESRNSWIAMRNYLEQLDDHQLKAMLKEKNIFYEYSAVIHFKW